MNPTHPSRRTFLRGTLAALGAGLTAPTWGRAADDNAPTLRALAEARGFWIGPAVAYNPLVNDATYRQVLAREFNFATAENALKWAATHPQRYQYTFTQADAIASFAWSNGQLLHGHTLLWHQSNPAWLTSGNWTRDEMIEILAEHIFTVASRYSGGVLAWDVVNEALNADGTLRDTIWSTRLGRDYLDWAFWLARLSDPYTLLVYNDHSAEVVNTKSNAIYNMVRDMQKRGTPIDGIGFQMHITTSGINYQSFAQNLQRFADLGLWLFITEMDVRMQLPVTPAKLAQQATVYQQVLNVCLNQPACLGLQTWGFTDRHSWIPGFYPGWGAALPFDENYAPKPAYDALLARLAV